MKRSLWLPLGVLFLAGCQDKPAPQAVEAEAFTDSLTQAPQPDSLVVAAEPEPPKAADGLFDDFIYNFMGSRRFQRERVRFPLERTSADGHTVSLQPADWTFNSLYAKHDVFLMLFGSERSMASQCDTALRSVAVEMVSLDGDSLTQYVFEKAAGRWQLTRIAAENLSANVNADFLSFYRRFAADADYRLQHVANPFSLVLQDPDTFEYIEGTADAVQWADYCPDLPAAEVANVSYGQTYADADHRVLVVSAPAGAMSSVITFHKQNGEWMAIRLENN